MMMTPWRYISPENRDNRVFLLVLLFLIAIFATLTFAGAKRMNKNALACQKAGGILVRHEKGTKRTCIKSSAIIHEWKQGQKLKGYE